MVTPDGSTQVADDDRVVDPATTVAEEMAELEPDTPAPPGAEAPIEFQLPSNTQRERALPIRPGDLSRLLLSDDELEPAERDHLHQFCRLVSATFHSSFHDSLKELKELYAPLDPDSDYVDLPGHTRERTEDSDEDFLIPFENALERANYRRLDMSILEEAISAPNELGLTYTPNFALFEHLRVYVRGYTQISRVVRSTRTRFRKRTVTLDAYQRLIVALKFREGDQAPVGPFVRSDVLYLRLFKDVPHVDMEMHLPEQGTSVRMRWFDKAQIASPLMIGLPTLAMKLMTLTLAATSPLTLGALMIAPVSAGINSFFGFQRAKQKHLSHMIRNLYYLTLANNASVLTRVIDSAEEEEYKETMLAYYFLWRKTRNGETTDRAALDSEVETFLRAKIDQEIDFEVGDALGKLFRLGLATRDSRGELLAVPIDEALVKLDRRWDNLFRFNL